MGSQSCGRRDLRTALKQRFQVVEGTASSAGKSVKPLHLTLSGNDFTFALPDGKGVARFAGRANGEAMEGTVELPGGKSACALDRNAHRRGESG